MRWTTEPLAELADLCLGKMLDEKKNRGDPLPYLANVNVRWGDFELDDLREMRFEHDEMDRYGLKYGDIVMCEGGEPGRCALWKEPVPAMMIQKALHRIRAHNCLDSRFLYYSFLCLGRRGAFAPLFTGATIKHLPREKLAKVEITFPPIEVQRHIADVLSPYDDLIENNRRRIQLLEQSARLLYREWFVHLRFPGHEHVTVVDGVPRNWKESSIEQLCIADDGVQTGPFGSQLHQSDYSENGIPVVMPKDIANFRISTGTIARVPEEIAERLSRHRMQAGDVVYGRRGDIGRRAYVSRSQAGWLCGTGCLRLRPDSSVVSKRFFFDALGAPKTEGTIVARAHGVTMPNLNTGILKSVLVLVPPKSLQDEYSIIVEPINEMIERLDEKNMRLVRARDLLLPRLMSGEIDV